MHDIKKRFFSLSLFMFPSLHFKQMEKNHPTKAIHLKLDRMRMLCKAFPRHPIKDSDYENVDVIVSVRRSDLNS